MLKCVKRFPSFILRKLHPFRKPFSSFKPKVDENNLETTLRSLSKHSLIEGLNEKLIQGAVEKKKFGERLISIMNEELILQNFDNLKADQELGRTRE